MRRLMCLAIGMCAWWMVGCDAAGPSRTEPAASQNGTGSDSVDDDTDDPGTTDQGNNIDNNDATDGDAADGAGGTNLAQEQGVAELQRFSSEEELLTYFREQTSQAGQYGYGNGDRPTDDASFDGNQAAGPTFGGDSAAGGGFGEGGGVAEDGAALGGAVPPSASSDTTVQEVGVDEADVVKTDGENIYILSPRYGYDDEGSSLQIVRATPADDLALLGSYEVEGYGGQLYLSGDRAVIITNRYRYPGSDAELAVAGFFLDVFASTLLDEPSESLSGVEDPVRYFFDLLAASEYRSDVLVTVLDISDPADPALITQTGFEGWLTESRMIDGVLRMAVTTETMSVGSFAPFGGNAIERLIAQMPIEHMLPTFEQIDASGASRSGLVLTFGDVFHPADADGTLVTSLITMDVDAPEQFDAVGLIANAGMLYASTEAMYVTDSAYYYDFRRVDTDIYKFAYTPGGVELTASGTVPGRIINQYAMSEYEGHLRVAASTDRLFDWESGDSIPSTNAVYVLAENGDALDIVGSVEGIAEGEQLQAARFLGPRGYLVTFLQIDPLFTLDLSDATAPRVVGELHVPGFSTFLMPLDEDHLLAIGQYVDPSGNFEEGGLQISIFDISDFANPLQSHNLVFGGWETYSEALWNPRALTFLAEEGWLAMPISHYGNAFGPDFGGFDDAVGDVAEDDVADATDDLQNDESAILAADEFFEGLLVFRISTEDGIEWTGKLNPDPNQSEFGFYASFTRGVFIHDNVFAVTDQSVVAAPALDATQPTSSLALPDPYDYDDFGEEPFLDGFPGATMTDAAPAADAKR